MVRVHRGVQEEALMSWERGVAVAMRYDTCSISGDWPNQEALKHRLRLCFTSPTPTLSPPSSVVAKGWGRSWPRRCQRCGSHVVPHFLLEEEAARHLCPLVVTNVTNLLTTAHGDISSQRKSHGRCSWSILVGNLDVLPVC